MSIDNGPESAQHLQDVFELYSKVKEFDAVELKYDYGSLDNNYHYYIKEDVDIVLDNFSRVFSVPSGQLEPLKEAMQSGIIDFMLLPQGDAASFATPIMSEEMISLLYLLSRHFFRSIRSSLNVDNIYWEEGKCPVCNAVPAVSLLEMGNKRKYFCSFCGTTGYFKRIGCTQCQNEDPKLIDIIYVSDDSDIRIDVCNNCKSYVKTIDQSKVSFDDIEKADLISLPLDIIAQERGFVRRCPNPVGMIAIS
jgi:FdhE protein